MMTELSNLGEILLKPEATEDIVVYHRDTCSVLDIDKLTYYHCGGACSV